MKGLPEKEGGGKLSPQRWVDKEKTFIMDRLLEEQKVAKSFYYFKFLIIEE